MVGDAVLRPVCGPAPRCSLVTRIAKGLAHSEELEHLRQSRVDGLGAHVRQPEAFGEGALDPLRELATRANELSVEKRTSPCCGLGVNRHSLSLHG